MSCALIHPIPVEGILEELDSGRIQSETGTIQKGYSDLTELIADYIRKGDQNGLSDALIHPIPIEGMLEVLSWNQGRVQPTFFSQI